MKKRLIALLCLLAIVVSVFAVGITAQGATEYYQVGYSKKDINPWLDPKDPSKGIIVASDETAGIPLAGYGGNVEDRIATSMIDDNGDGKVDENDGLFTTCTIVADPDGKLLIFFTLDCISPYGTAVSTVRSNVVSKLSALGANISSDRIMITGSHSHTAPNFTNLTAEATTDDVRSAYYDYIISQMTQAAVDAYNDMADATMSKRELDVSEDYGYQMNWVRHVNVPYTVQQIKSSLFNSTTTTLGFGSLVAGSNFGYFSGTKMFDESGNWLSKTTINAVMDTANRTHVAAADDTLQMLTFEFTDSSKDTVVMIDWRAHPDNIGGYYISSDYVGSLRYRLEQNKSFGGTANYRVGFWQGASGNINAFSAIEDEAYFDAEVSGLVNDGAAESKSSVPYNKYGYMLAEAALLNLEGSAGTTTSCSVGSIRNMQISKYTVDRQVFTDAEKAAAAAIGTTYAEAAAEDYPYEYNGGVINSEYHWNKVNEQINQIAAGTFKATLTIEINALMIGEDMAFVVSPNELFDRYDADMSIDDADNDWNELINNDTYGTPFILAYTNNHMGYIPNVMAYHYNEGDEYTGYNKVGTGSYEANTANYAEGTGEALVDQYASMLQLLAEGTLKKVCEHCGGEAVEWTPLTKDIYKNEWEPGGHYYLTEDVGIDYSAQKVCGTSGTTKYTEDGTFCLDLNGFNIDTIGRAFNAQNNNTLNLMDSVGTGVVTAHGGTNNPGGGVLTVAGGGYLNVYGGTYQLDQTESGYTGRGGIAMVSGGTMTMYGGTLVGGELKTGYYDPLYGGAVVVGGKLIVYGGTITAAELDENVTGSCVYVLNSSTNSVTLSGDAHVDEIYYENVTGANLVVDGSFTGYAKLHYNSTNVTLADGLDIGNSTDASFHQSAFSVWTSAADGYTSATEHTKSYVDVDGTDIKYFLEPVVQIISGTTTKNYSELSTALSEYTAGTTLKLMQNIDAITAPMDMTIDLNGYTLTSLTAGSYTVSCMDSQTADSDISDGVYGKVVSYTGTVEAVELSIDKDTYLMVETGDGMTFHAVDLRLTTASLRPYYYANGVKTDTVGLYYKGAFAGDTVVAGKVTGYGVALSTTAVPSVENLDTDCERSYFTGFASGAAGNTSASTVLYDIMKLANTPMANRVNAEMVVYARAYVETADGMLFGEHVAYSLKDIMLLYDAQLKKAVTDLPETIQGWYNNYSTIMKSWNIPYIKNYITSQELATAEDSIKILGIGNSFTIDCMKPLYNIYKAHSPNKKVTLGILYYSGCTLAQHESFLLNEDAVYQYYECSDATGGEWVITGKISTVNGVTTYTDCYTLQQGVKAQDWDIVTMQQGVMVAAQADTYNDDIGVIRNCVIENLGYEPKFVWNMTWALPEDEDEPNGVLKDYPANTDTYNYYDTFLSRFGSNANMYAMIASSVQQKILLGDYDWDYMIPVGTAIQNAKTNYDLDYVDLYADYCHIRSLGSIIAAYTWYCELNGLTELYQIPEEMHTLEAALIRDTVKTGENTYESVGDVTFTEEQLQIIMESVNGALKNNFKVTAP